MPSTHLRTLAWLRRLLDDANDVRAWALGRRAAPEGWTRREPDAQHLRDLFQKGAPPAIHKDARKRHPSLLDQIFAGMLHGDRAPTGRWFGDRLLKGEVKPSASQLQRFDDLVPGSREAFDGVPDGLAPDFYDAMDFCSPWYGRLHLWRLMDPSKSDAAWERLLADGHVEEPGDDELMPSGFPVGAWRRRFERWTVRPGERRRLRAEIALALAHVAYPDRVDDDPNFKSPLRILHDARASCDLDASLPNPVRDPVRTWDEPKQWAALTDALAALRLDRIAVIGDGLAAWWVRSVMAAMAATIEKREREWFCSMTNGAPPLTTFIEGLLRPIGKSAKSLVR